MATLGFSLINAILYLGGHFTSAINLTLLQGAIPAFTLIGARLAYSTPIRGMQVLGIVVTLLGIALVASGGEWERLTRLAFNVGDLAMVFASMLYAGYTVGLKSRPPLPALTFFAAIAIIAAITSAPLAAGEMAMGFAFTPSLLGLAILVFVAIGPSFLSQVFFIRAVEMIGPTRAGLFTNLVPAIGALLAILILGEPFGWHHALAMVFVLGGIAIAERGR
jgi:drug/metabolite transporter (DMT)-like permease